MIKANYSLASGMTVGEIEPELDYSSSKEFGKAFKRRFDF